MPFQSPEAPPPTFAVRSRVSFLYYFSTIVLLAFATFMLVLAVLLPLRGWGEPGILFYTVMAALGGVTAWVVILYFSPRVYRVSLEPAAGRIVARVGPLFFRKRQRTLSLDKLGRVDLERGEREGSRSRTAQHIVPVFRVRVDGAQPLFSDDDELLCRRLAEKICVAAHVPLQDRTGLESVRVAPEEVDLPLVERLSRQHGLAQPAPEPPSTLISVKRSPAELQYRIRSRPGLLARSTTLIVDGTGISVKISALGIGLRRAMRLDAVERLSADERTIKSTVTGVQKQSLFRILSDEQVIDIPTGSRGDAEWLRDRVGFDLIDLLTTT